MEAGANNTHTQHAHPTDSAHTEREKSHGSLHLWAYVCASCFTRGIVPKMAFSVEIWVLWRNELNWQKNW